MIVCDISYAKATKYLNRVSQGFLANVILHDKVSSSELANEKVVLEFFNIFWKICQGYH